MSNPDMTNDTLADELARIVQETGPIVVDAYGEGLAWRPIDYGTWVALRTPPTSTDERKDVLEAEKTAFTFAFAAGFKCADETSRQCASAMDDAWDDYRAVRALTTKGERPEPMDTTDAQGNAWDFDR